MVEDKEHLEGHHEIATLNRLERERGGIPWRKVYTWFIKAPPDFQEKIAELLTGKTDGKINLNEPDPDRDLLLYYLYILHRVDLDEVRTKFSALDLPGRKTVAQAVTGDPNGKIDIANSAHQAALMAHFYPDAGIRKFEQVFGEIYKTRFDSAKKREGPDEELPAKPEEMSELLITAKNHRKEEDRESASARVRRNLGKYKRLADHYGIIFPPFLGILYGLRADPAQLINTAAGNIDAFETELIDLYKQLKGAEKAIPNLIKIPVPGNVVVYLCIRQEHALLGKLEKDLEEAAAEDFAKFAVYVTSVDFGGIRPVDPEHPKLSGYRYDIQKAGAMVNPFEWLKKGRASILSEFPVFEGITPGSTAHDIEHHFEKLGTKELAEFMAFLRIEALKEREKGLTKGVARKDLTEISNLVKVLEEMLAERMKKAIAEGESKDAWKRAAAVTRSALRVPARHVEHDSKKARIHLKGARLPRVEGEHKAEKKGWLEKWGAIGGIVSGTLHAIEVAMNLIKGRSISSGGGDKPDAKKDPSKGH